MLSCNPNGAIRGLLIIISVHAPTCVHRDMKYVGRLESTKKCARVARGVAESNSSSLSAAQTSQVLHMSMNVQLTHEPIVL